MSRNLVAVVTGSNRGIGNAICQTLASHNGPKPLIIYATSRSGDDLAIKASNNNNNNNNQISILINNAGINVDASYSYPSAKKTIDLNYRSTRQTCELFLSEGKMSSTSGARIVNVTSGACMLKDYPGSVVSKLRSSSPTLTFPELDEMVESYLSAVKDGKEKESGRNHRELSYSVSKAFLNAATFILARENKGVLINCCCPGWVKTDMGGQVGNGGKKPADGAKIQVRLAIGDIGGVSGKYWANEGVQNTDDWEVRDW